MLFRPLTSPQVNDRIMKLHAMISIDDSALFQVIIMDEF